MEGSRSVSDGSAERPTKVFLLAANHAEAEEFARHYQDATIVDDVREVAQQRGGTVILCGHHYDRLGASYVLEKALGCGMRVMFQRQPGEAPHYEREPDFGLVDLSGVVACGECGTLRARSATYCTACRAMAAVRP